MSWYVYETNKDSKIWGFVSHNTNFVIISGNTIIDIFLILYDFYYIFDTSYYTVHVCEWLLIAFISILWET